MPDGHTPSPPRPADPAAPEGGPPSQAQKTQADAEPGSPGWTRLLRWRRKRAEPGLGGMLNGENPPVLTAAERLMIERIVAFDTKRVEDVLIPRADINAVELDAGLADVLSAFSDAGHSRLPVYRGDLDDPVGMVHIKDVVGLLADPQKGEPRAEADGDPKGEPLLKALIRRVLYVPPSMPITDLLLRMQAQRVHMALVIDEFGGTDGLVTIEDLIEEIVGDIRDEHDDEQALVLRQTQSGRWDADARMELDELEEKTGLHLKLDDEEADTIGGLVASLSGRVPVRGEVIRHPEGYEFEVAEADPRRIRRVLIRTKRRRRRPEGEGRPVEVVPKADNPPGEAEGSRTSAA